VGKCIRFMGRIISLDRYLLLRIVANIKNKLWDFVYSGTSLGGIIRPKNQHAYNTSSTDYSILQWVFDRVPIVGSDVLVDVGCGKGRVIMYWLKRGYKNKIVGIELNEDVAINTKKTLSEYKNVSIISGNVLEYIPIDGTIFFLFNPFDEQIMCLFKESIATSNNNITIIYLNCMHINVFKNDPNWDVLVHDVNIPLSGIKDCEVAVVKLVSERQSESVK